MITTTFTSTSTTTNLVKKKNDSYLLLVTLLLLVLVMLVAQGVDAITSTATPSFSTKQPASLVQQRMHRHHRHRRRHHFGGADVFVDAKTTPSTTRDLVNVLKLRGGGADGLLSNENLATFFACT